MSILQKHLVQLQSRTEVSRDWVIFVIIAPGEEEFCEIFLLSVKKSKVSFEHLQFWGRLGKRLTIRLNFILKLQETGD